MLASPVQVATYMAPRYAVVHSQRVMGEEPRRLAAAASAVRAGSQARALLLYARLVHGGVTQAVRRGDARAMSEWLRQFDWSDLRDMARARGVAQTGDRAVLTRRLCRVIRAAVLERAAAQQRQREAAAQAELEAIHGSVPRSRVVNYAVPELRSGGGRQGRPVARGYHLDVCI